MGHEEVLCRQAWRFVEAKERKADYELYYTLAHVFGVLSEQAFHRTHRPGELHTTGQYVLSVYVILSYPEQAICTVRPIYA